MVLQVVAAIVNVRLFSSKEYRTLQRIYRAPYQRTNECMKYTWGFLKGRSDQLRFVREERSSSNHDIENRSYFGWGWCEVTGGSVAFTADE